MGNDIRSDKDTRLVTADQLEKVTGGTSLPELLNPVLDFKQTAPETGKACPPGNDLNDGYK